MTVWGDVDRGFASLRASVVEAGLFERAYGAYAWRTAAAYGLLGAGLALASSQAVLSAGLIAFGSVQIALVGHDAGHNAVFTSKRANTRLAIATWTLTLAISFAYWNDRHTRHHTSTNEATTDPDLQWDVPPSATALMAFTLRLEGWRHALRRRDYVELLILGLSTAAWLAPAVAIGPGWLLTFAASQVLASLYLAGVVAPNHIGMPTWQTGAAPGSFLEHQVTSSRNVLPHPVVDFVFGGLNYQIEHHLFPSMPRNHLAAARALVKPFCADNGLPYIEANLADVYRAVLAELPGLAQRA